MPTARRQYILMTRHLSSLRFRLIVRILLAVIAAAELTQVSAAGTDQKSPPREMLKALGWRVNRRTRRPYLAVQTLRVDCCSASGMRR